MSFNIFNSWSVEFILCVTAVYNLPLWKNGEFLSFWKEWKKCQRNVEYIKYKRWVFSSHGPKVYMRYYHHFASFLSASICFSYSYYNWFDFWCLNATFSNISAISWWPVLVMEEAGVPRDNRWPWASNW